MKIILTSLLHGTRAMDIYENSVGNQLVIWHQDTLSHEQFDQLIQTHGKPDILITSAHPEYAGYDVEHYYWPDDLWQIAEQIDKWAQIQDHETEYCFNFMINKNQTNRYLLIKLIEWYNLQSCEYTWRGSNTFNCSQILNELSLQPVEFASHVQQFGFKLQPKFIDLPAHIPTSNVQTWNHALRDLFSKSAVSLITESVGVEKIINFTEKTLFSVQALTFPIWVGGYAQAKLWADHGFDTFDDVINHDYQYCDTLTERCHRAVSDNLKLLTDLEHVKNLRNQHRLRLLNNRSQLKSNLSTVFLNKWKNMPIDLQQTLAEMIKTWPIEARQRGFKLLNL